MQRETNLKISLKHYTFPDVLHYYFSCLYLDTLCWFQWVKSDCDRTENKTATVQFNFQQKPSQGAVLRQEILHTYVTSSASLIYHPLSYPSHRLYPSPISQNTSDKRDFSRFLCCRLRVMLMSNAGSLLRNADSRLFCHQWNSNRQKSRLWNSEPTQD